MNPKWVFDAATDFRIASELLEAQFGQRIFPLRSTVVTAAFAIELYLKCLLTISNTAIPQKHKFIDLFDALPENEKNLVRKNYQAVSSQGSALEQILNEYNDIFVEWRYVFEKQQAQFQLHFRSLRLLATALYQVIIELHPNWTVQQ